MSKKEYYVYALIDPRNNEFFYIGKGKGIRFAAHLKPNKLDFNYGKHDRIKKIQELGLEVKIEILFPNLDESSAFELEKLVIYKLGRSIFSEGILTNLNPGGRWKKGDSVFYASNSIPTFDSNKLDFISQQKLNEIPQLSKFNYLNTNLKKQVLYKYRKDGTLNKKISLNELFSKGVRGNEIALLKVLRENNSPIYSRWIYSKYSLENFYVSENIPFAEFDLVDEKFNRDFDIKFEKQEAFKSKFVVDGILRMVVEKTGDVIELESYYLSGRKKSYRKTKNGKPYELALEWFENGHLSAKDEIFDGYKSFTRTTYFEESGKEHIQTSRGENKKTYVRWYDNGKKEIEYLENIGYVHYNRKGEKIKLIKNV